VRLAGVVAGRYAPGSGHRGGDRRNPMPGWLFEKHEVVLQTYTHKALATFEYGRHPEPAGSGWISIVLNL
jgi:hypothetical protein